MYFVIEIFIILRIKFLNAYLLLFLKKKIERIHKKFRHNEKIFKVNLKEIYKFHFEPEIRFRCFS
nr:hypothetical protein [Dinophyceae sp. MRD-151]